MVERYLLKCIEWSEWSATEVKFCLYSRDRYFNMCGYCSTQGWVRMHRSGCQLLLIGWFCLMCRVVPSTSLPQMRERDPLHREWTTSVGYLNEWCIIQCDLLDDTTEREQNSPSNGDMISTERGDRVNRLHRRKTKHVNDCVPMLNIFVLEVSVCMSTTVCCVIYRHPQICEFSLMLDQYIPPPLYLAEQFLRRHPLTLCALLGSNKIPFNIHNILKTAIRHFNQSSRWTLGEYIWDGIEKLDLM